MPQGGLKTWLDAILGLFYPEICQICRGQRATVSDGYVCRTCEGSGENGVRRIAPPFCDRCGLPYSGELVGTFRCANCAELNLHFDYARSAVLAKGVVLQAIHRYKYHRAIWFETFLARLLLESAQSDLRTGFWDAVVPIPLHPAKLRQREFNQAERIARRLGRGLGIPVNTRLLRRVQSTETQTRLTRPERTRNVLNAFCLRNAGDLTGRHFVLVDDVLTTGSTSSECARVLKSAGASRVIVWTVARGALD